MRTKTLFRSLAPSYGEDPCISTIEMVLDVSAEKANREGCCPDFWIYEPRGDVSELKELFEQSPQGAFSKLAHEELERLNKFSNRLLSALKNAE